MTAVSDTKSAGYVLHSELAQFCLPAAHRDRNQKLAWVNSLCLLYLIIGGIGLRPPLPSIRELQALDEPVVQVIEPLPQEIKPEETTEQMEEAPPEMTDVPNVVAVTIDSPAVNFAVPTVGNLLVSERMATAPPLRPMQAAVQKLTTNQIFNIRTTGRGGSYPSPDYPQRALQLGMKGLTILLIKVDATGKIEDIQLEKSTGFKMLDDHTLAHIRRFFTFPTDQPGTYRLPVQYGAQ